VAEDLMLGPASDLGERLAAPLSRDARLQAAGLRETAHRPWPLPAGRWLQGQTWQHLLFAHWPVPAEALRPAVPAELPVDTFDGTAWLGITPFRVTGARPRGTVPVPVLSSFLETNVRTYATVDGRPGIWFLSLDAESTLAVLGARRSYRLPYFRAHMGAEREGDGLRYRTRRDDPPAALALRYRPAGQVFTAAPGTLEHFLTERYCLYALDARHRLLSADIHHAPWPLQAAEAEIAENTMTAPYGIALPDSPPLLHYARRQDVVIWPLRRAGGPATAKGT
jgi:uncharacterized protein YqjF (DUF2071 family)